MVWVMVTLSKVVSEFIFFTRIEVLLQCTRSWAGAMAPWSRMLAFLVEGPSSVPSTTWQFTAVCNSSPRGFDTVFYIPRYSRYAGKIFTHIRQNKVEREGGVGH